MFDFQKQLAKNPIIKFLSSVKIAVVCLGLLFILTLWGTLFQVDHGLYLAQEKFFNSLVFTFLGFVPFPGARLVMGVLFINLVCMCLIRLVYRWSNAGIVIIHIGLLTFLISGFVTFYTVNESNLSLIEGAGSNVSSLYHDWEISVWREGQEKRDVYAFNVNEYSQGKDLDFSSLGISVFLKNYYSNSNAYTTADEKAEAVINNVGIKTLRLRSFDKAPEKNLPGLIAEVTLKEESKNIILYGGESDPTKIDFNGEGYFFQLRREKEQLPFVIKLKDFMMEVHPNTQIARSYKSLVEVITPGASREVLISMNKPLRAKNYTLYQASYAVDQMGREISTLAVVRNSGRILPYVASSITCFGLAWHFLVMAFRRKKRRK
jgi:hypothetical protein